MVMSGREEWIRAEVRIRLVRAAVPGRPGPAL